jgi:ribonuclease HI
MKTIEIFTDGACRGNPGDGGWGVLIRTDGHEETIYGGEENTTNNRMELLATIKALNFIAANSNVTLTTDSKYVIDGITKWIENWKIKNWKKSDNKPVLNKDLWILLDQASSNHSISWHWVRGHTGHRENEIADELANKGIDELS